MRPAPSQLAMFTTERMNPIVHHVPCGTKPALK